ncbi:MAG: CdaR family protein [Byssovorax sp.]
MTAKDGFREQLRAAFFDNMGLKALSVGSALALYAFIHGADNDLRTLPVNVVAAMPPLSANRQLLTQLPNEVSITLRGSRTQLDTLRTDDLGSIRLDLRSGRESTIELDPDTIPSMINIPIGLAVEQVIPSQIKVRWDDVVSRQIPVQVARTGDPAPGYTMKGSIVIDPAEITAKGPRSIVDVMQFARSAPFDVSGLTEGTYRRPLPLDKPPNLVTFSPESVITMVEIGRELVTKQFPRLKVEVIGLPRATTNPPTVTVFVTGTAADVSALLPEAIVPRVEPKTAGDDTTKPGSDNLPVLVDLPRVKATVEPPKVVVKW